MFKDSNLRHQTSTQSAAERIGCLPDSEIGLLDERRETLRKALGSFDGVLSRLPAKERKAALSLLFKEFGDTLFDFHLSAEKMLARSGISRAETKVEKIKVLQSFREETEFLAKLYDVGE